ncbi:sensor histidine kinase [Algoriphagus hitonicola]|uniref:7TM diverse intracellular signalling n=1 Tax=Algoriphagus hitonicola TaxID=435880 RepID=A0A1I2REB4_9BACT|nr:histidine kinase [Algoriphagus hitonicola]SFG36086.1 7TM diverse intracellular signalling [Algoriphagus hitonicola]
MKVWILVLSLVQFPLFAQQTDYHFREPIKPRIISTDSSATIDEILDLANDGVFEKAEAVGVAKRKYIYWLELDFDSYHDILEEMDSIYLYPGNLEVSTLYIISGSGLDSMNLTRLGKNDLQKATFPINEYVGIAKRNFFEPNKLYIKAHFYRATPNLDSRLLYFSDPDSHRIFSGFISHASFKNQVLAYFFLGVAAVLMVFNLILFFYMKEKQYFFYGGFLLFQLIYFSQISPFLASYFGFGNLAFFFWLSTIAQILINLFYLLFIRYFLEFPKFLPVFDRIVIAVALLLIALVVLNSGLIMTNPYQLFQARLMDYHQYFMASFAFGGVIYLWLRYPGNLKYFVIAGTLVFTTGALMTMFLLELKFMVTASAIESTIFALGLSYKIKVISQEKRIAEKNAYQTKLGALRAQINPHFIFNSLSSIQYLINTEQKEAALSYLSKFSKFVRQVLENSIDVHVNLEKEIELLKVYLDLESLRFDHAFHYEIEVPEHLDLSFFEVPMLIVQPFVENAIKHGLMPKQERDRRLWVRFIEEEDFIRCEIEDNGIGRKRAQELSGKSKHRPSRGMELTAERLRMQAKGERESSIKIEDLGQGTKVTIKLNKQ